MKTCLLLAAAIVLSVASGLAVADPHPREALRDPSINARQHLQGDRVRQGIRSGELTRSEVQDINRQRRAIRQNERLYKSDGRLDRVERKDLHQDLNATSRDIYEQKHDAERR